MGKGNIKYEHGFGFFCVLLRKNYRDGLCQGTLNILIKNEKDIYHSYSYGYALLFMRHQKYIHKRL